MKIQDLLEQEPEEEMTDPENMPEPTDSPAPRNEINSLEAFVNAVSQEEMVNVILYFNVERLQGSTTETKQRFVARALQRLHAGSPYTNFGTYIGNSSNRANIRFPGWVRSWSSLANYYKIIARRYEGQSVQPDDEQRELNDETSTRDKVELIRDAFRGRNNYELIVRVIMSITAEAQWEEMKSIWAETTRPPGLVERLNNALSPQDKASINRKLEELGSEDRLDTGADPNSLRNFWQSLTIDGYDNEQVIDNHDDSDELFARIGDTLANSSDENIQGQMIWMLSSNDGVESGPLEALRDLKQALKDKIDAEDGYPVSHAIYEFGLLFRGYSRAYQDSQN